MSPNLAPHKVIQKLSLRNKLAFFTSLIAFLFLFPGIYLSMLTVTTNGSVNAKLPHIEKNVIGLPKIEGTQQERIKLDLFDTTRSILKTIHDLWNKNYFFVATMIFLFSVIIPFGKGCLITYIFFTNNSERRKKIFSFIKAIGKWSMCDVFIVAILLSYLSTGATEVKHTKDITLMGFDVHVNVLASMQAQLHIGYWCFVAYCLLSLLALQLYEPY